MKFLIGSIFSLLPSLVFAASVSLGVQIDSAIDDLVKRQGDGWFMVLEDPKTKKFVQYALHENHEFYFDLPSQVLSKHELDRAKKVLFKYGMEFETWDMLDKPNGVVVGKQSGFGRNIGSDVSLAKKLAREIFIQVYKLDPNTKLTVVIER